jgi:hypothetical protein
VSEQTAAYRLHDESGLLLYIGAAVDPAVRFAKHAATKEWWPLVARREIQWHQDRESALTAEKAAIRAEHPARNVTYTPRQTVAPRAPTGWTAAHPLAGASEIGSLLGVSRQRVQQIVGRPSFPAPCAEIIAGRIWQTAAVIAWAEGRGRTLVTADDDDG